MPLNNPVKAANVVSGQYTGDDTGNRQILTGFKCSAVILVESTGSYLWVCNNTVNSARTSNAPAFVGGSADMQLHATDGFIVDALQANTAPRVYKYWAISE